MPRKPILLLVFIHGFKGDDDTFVEFPEHLQAILQSARPNLHVAVAKYPRYETRGELPACVLRFREWLQNTVIDIEVSVGTPSPTVDPSVHTILIGHSMGGIVAADTVLSIVDDKLITSGRDETYYGPEDIKLMFPHIIGVLAFDTPYLGLAPSMFAHGAEGNWNKATSVFGTVSQVASGLFSTAGGAAASQALLKANADAEEARERERREKQKQGGLLGGWGKVAALTAAGTALAGGAAAAYIHREHITNGFTWVSSHLEFVGSLMKGEELNNRVQRVSTLPNMGFANLFTSLGRNFGTHSFYEGKERTFCNIPAQHTPLRKKWYRCINESVKDEVGAHVAMFAPKTNPNFYELADRAKQLITVWVPEGAFPLIPDYDEIEYSRESKRKSKSHKSSSSSKKDKDRESSSHSSSRHVSRTNSMEPESESRRKSKSEKHHKSLSRSNTMEPEYYEQAERRRSRTEILPLSRANSMPVNVEYIDSSHHRKSKSDKHKPVSRTNSMEPNLESMRSKSERKGSSHRLIDDERSERRSSKSGRSGTNSPRYEEYEVRDRDRRKESSGRRGSRVEFAEM